MKKTVKQCLLAVAFTAVAILLAPSSLLAQDYTISGGTASNPQVINITQPGDYTLTGSGIANVIINAEGEVNLTLDNVNIEAGNYQRTSRFNQGVKVGTAAISIEGNTVCKVNLVGNNTLKGYSIKAQTPLSTAAIYVENAVVNDNIYLASVVIGGTGALKATGGIQAAAIGGNANRLAGNITINGGTIEAVAGIWGAAIGDGDTMDSDIMKWNCANEAINNIPKNCCPATIKITAGTVTAISSVGTPAIGASDDLCNRNGVTRNGEWNGMRIELLGGKIVAVGSGATNPDTPSAAIGAGSRTYLSPANLVIKDENSATSDLKLLALSRISAKNNQSTYPLSARHGNLPSMSSDSSATLVNVLGVSESGSVTTGVNANTLDVTPVLLKMFNERELETEKIQAAITELDAMLDKVANNYNLTNVVGMAMTLPLKPDGTYVVDPSGKFYPSDISISEDIKLIENAADATYTATVTRDDRDTHAATTTYSYIWQRSTDGGNTWSNITSGNDGYTIESNGKTSTLTLDKANVLVSRNLDQYRCMAELTTGTINQEITSGAAKLHVYNYYTITMNFLLKGDDGTSATPVALEEVLGSKYNLYAVKLDEAGEETSDITELTMSENGASFSGKFLNGTYVVKIGKDKDNLQDGMRFEEIIVSNADPDPRNIYFHTVTYTDGVENEAVFANQVDYYLINYPVDAMSLEDVGGKDGRSGYDFTGWSDGSKTYQAGDGITNQINKNITLTAQWAQRVNLTANVTIKSDGDDDFALNEVPIQLYARKLGTSDPFEPVSGKTTTITMTPDGEGATTYSGGPYTFSDLPSGYEYTFRTTAATGSYLTKYSNDCTDSVNQTANLAMTYKVGTSGLTFSASAAAIAADQRPQAVNFMVMRTTGEGAEWEQVDVNRDNNVGPKDVVSLAVDSSERVSGSVAVKAFQDEEHNKPYYYRLEVVSYEMPDGSTVAVNDQKIYTSTMKANETPQIGRTDVASFETGGVKQVGTLHIDITAQTYTVSYNLNGKEDVASVDSTATTGLIQMPAKATMPTPSITKTGLVFLGWYADEQCTTLPNYGAYLNKDMTLYAKWAEAADISGSVFIDYTYGNNNTAIKEEERQGEATVILQVAHKDTSEAETASNDWNTVASQTISFNTSAEVGDSKDFTFQNIPTADQAGHALVYRVTVNQPGYTAYYDITAFTDDTVRTGAATSPTAGSYHVQLVFKPSEKILSYQIDISALSTEARKAIGTLQGVVASNTAMDLDKDIASWGSTIYQHQDKILSFNVKDATGNYVGANDDKATSVWVPKGAEDTFKFRLKLVNSATDRNPVTETEGYRINYTAPVFYDRNYGENGRWTASDTASWYMGNEANGAAVTAEIEPKNYPLVYYLEDPSKVEEGAIASTWSDATYKVHTWGKAIGADALSKQAPDKSLWPSGYEFAGWKEVNVDGSNPQDVGAIAALDTNQHYYLAQWTKSSEPVDPVGPITEKVTLHYDTNGGSEIADKIVAKNTVVDLSGTTPRREGYTFTGWYADEDLTKKIDDIKMTTDKTVYAGWAITGIPGMLNGTDHFAYVQGYPNGLVMPQGNITRAEVATIFFRLLNNDVREENLSKSNSFTDTKKDAWYNIAVSTLSDMGILRGYEDGSFRPNANITRAEFAAIAARFDESDIANLSTFTDIDGHWAETDISHAATLGWISGYPDGTFGPNKDITRAETMSLVNRVLKRLSEKESDLLSTMTVWSDCAPSAWYYLAVQEATNSHNYERKQDGVHEKWNSLRQSPDWSRYE